ncbi:MAG: pentapeptide repeat-containing protein [Pseudomonadota bacterium]
MEIDPTLSVLFFSPSTYSGNIVEEQEIIGLLIKQKLYPHLISGTEPSYAKKLSSFSTIGPTEQEEYIKLQNELSITIRKIKQWGAEQHLPGIESLTAFKDKLAVPSDINIPMYRDGKKILETIAVLIDEPQINLERRKQIIINMLADRELTKCIAGCYARISSAAEQLIGEFHGPRQISRWFQSYVKAEAMRVATQRAFPMPVSHQTLLCKASDCSEEHYMLHANNYLLQKAKEYGFPITLPRDTGAMVLDRNLSTNDKHMIVTAYIKQLEKTVSADNLVTYISGKLHEHIESVLSRDLNFSDKVDIIKTQLNLLGDDKLALDEIFTTDGQLKSAAHLKITVTERLLQRGLLKNVSMHKLKSPIDGKTIEYHIFPSLALSWFQIDNERKLFLPFIKENGLSKFVVWQTHLPHEYISNFFLQDFLIKNTENLLLIINNLPKDKTKSFLNWISLEHVVSVVKQSVSPDQFVDILKSLPDKNEAKKFLRACGNTLVRSILQEGISQVNIGMLYPGLSFKYEAKDYNVNLRQADLKLTKELLQLILKNDFRDFRQFIFYKISYLNYLEGISFLGVDLKNAQFFQPISDSQFDLADLRGTKFKDNLHKLSFQRVDLRSVLFPLLNAQVSALDLHTAVLSTTSFAQLRNLDITDFSGANLRQVDFQHATVKTYLRNLNFHEANLESVDLSQLDLQGTWFTKTNLAKANLIGTLFSGDNRFDHHTKLESSQFTLSTVRFLHQRVGVRNFDDCRITIDWKIASVSAHVPASTYFEKVSFKGAKFIGEVLRATFSESDLTGTMFGSLSQNQPSTLHVRIVLRNSLLDRATFNQVIFLSETQFSDSSIKDVVFNKVEMHPDLLFKFYEQGHRNFLGVKHLQGRLSDKLLPFPMLSAALNKQVFLRLYQLGLRDFRGSNLNGFYLGALLQERAISDIDLKLEGARYRPFLLRCGHSRRSLESGHSIANPSCTTHFLFQSQVKNKRVISLDDINQLVQSSPGKKPFVLRELTLRMEPIFSLERINELNIHWGYQPQITDFTKLRKFIDNARPSTRSALELKSYIYQPVVDTNRVEEFAKSLEFIGFTQIRVEYANTQKQSLTLKIEAGKLSITQTQENLLAKLHVALERKKKVLAMPIPTLIPKSLPVPVPPKPVFKVNRDRLNRVMLQVKMNLKSVRHIASREASVYEIAAVIMDILHQWYINRGPEAKAIDASTKASLKILAGDIAREVGKQRTASDYQIELAERMARQCIDRGECSNEELVINDVVDTLHRMRPDLVIGNEVLFKKIKESFITIASFLSNQFDRIKQFFSRNEYNKQKRAIIDWYESPHLMQLIKAIESGFDVLGLDLQQSDFFSEEELIDFLSILWQALETQGITSHTATESILALLKNNTFIAQNLNLPQQSTLLVEPKSFQTPIPLVAKESDEITAGLVPSTKSLSINATSPSDLIKRQKRTIHSSKFSQAINTSIFFQRKETKSTDPYFGVATAAMPELITTKTTRSYYQHITSPDISRVTATNDTNSTLFLLDTAVRYWTRNPHRPMAQQSSPGRDKQVERKIQMLIERKPFNRSGLC